MVTVTLKIAFILDMQLKQFVSGIFSETFLTVWKLHHVYSTVNKKENLAITIKSSFPHNFIWTFMYFPFTLKDFMSKI